MQRDFHVTVTDSTTRTHGVFGVAALCKADAAKYVLDRIAEDSGGICHPTVDSVVQLPGKSTLCYGRPLCYRFD
jgi:hypothetical protein